MVSTISRYFTVPAVFVLFAILVGSIISSFFTGTLALTKNYSFLVVIGILIAVVITSVVISFLLESPLLGISYFVSLFPAAVLVYVLVISSICSTAKLGWDVLLVVGWAVIPFVCVVYLLIEAIILATAIVLPLSPIKGNTHASLVLSPVISLIIGSIYTYFIFTSNIFSAYILHSFHYLFC